MTYLSWPAETCWLRQTTRCNDPWFLQSVWQCTIPPTTWKAQVLRYPGQPGEMVWIVSRWQIQVVDGDKSTKELVLSRDPQGTVLWRLMFLINDLLSRVHVDTRCPLRTRFSYRQTSLGNCNSRLYQGKQLNHSKCHVLSARKQSHHHQRELCGVMLKSGLHYCC